MRTLIRSLTVAALALVLLLGAASTASADAQPYTIQPGDTLFKISVRFGVSMDAIRAANGITGDRIYSGLTIIIPDPNAPTAPPPPPATGGTVHVVQRGETLFSIGLKYNLTWTRIQAANGLAGTTVYVGQRLTIPAAGSVVTPPDNTPPADPPAGDPPAPPAAGTVHVVLRGESLSIIGRQYGVPWTAIMSANNLASTTIYTGQRLSIPSTWSDTPVSTPGQVPPAPAVHLNGKRFLVDLSDQMLYAYEGDKMVRSTRISSGTWRTPTVTGTYYIYLRYTSARMRGPGYDLANVPFVMYFYKGYGLHGTYWHNNFGTPMSHGCVNMPTPEAEWAFHWSEYGTPVVVQP